MRSINFGWKERGLTMRYLKPLLLGCLIVLLGISSCNKCYYCYAEEGSYRAIKGLDTISFTVYSKSSIADSIAFYAGMGYHIDTLATYSVQYPQLNQQICAKADYNYAIGMGDSCVEHN